MLQRYGLEPDQEKLKDACNRGQPPRLTVLETQKLFDPDLRTIRQQHHLSQEDGAYACALTTAWFVKECVAKIGLEVGLFVAEYGFIEGTKTVPRPEDGEGEENRKRPWYRWWR